MTGFRLCLRHLNRKGLGFRIDERNPFWARLLESYRAAGKQAAVRTNQLSWINQYGSCRLVNDLKPERYAFFDIAIVRHGDTHAILFLDHNAASLNPFHVA